MDTTGRVRAYIAMSLDGFIAGPQGEIDWLTTPRDERTPMAAGPWLDASPSAVDFDTFVADVGCMLMGRGTFDVVSQFEDGWFYGDLPVLVATSRPLTHHLTVDGHPAQVRAVTGDVRTLVDLALAEAGGKDVYVDGGKLIRAVMDAGLLDHAIVTVVPTVLGEGIPLFAGAGTTQFTVHDVTKYDAGMVQLALEPRRRSDGAGPAA